MSTRLVEVTPQDQGIRAELARHTLPEDQQRFAVPASESLPRGDADPGRMSVAILSGETAVGMFALDRGGYLAELDEADRPAGTVLLRAFYIAPAHQGLGHASAAVRQLPGFVLDHLPDASRVVLTVNHANAGAIAAYLRGGFVDTGRDYLGGDRGPQHVLALDL